LWDNRYLKTHEGEFCNEHRIQCEFLTCVFYNFETPKVFVETELMDPDSLSSELENNNNYETSDLHDEGDGCGLARLIIGKNKTSLNDDQPLINAEADENTTEGTRTRLQLHETGVNESSVQWNRYSHFPRYWPLSLSVNLFNIVASSMFFSSQGCSQDLQYGGAI
jgi:hypothetical protein